MCGDCFLSFSSSKTVGKGIQETEICIFQFFCPFLLNALLVLKKALVTLGTVSNSSPGFVLPQVQTSATTHHSNKPPLQVSESTAKGSGDAANIQPSSVFAMPLTAHPPPGSTLKDIF